MQVIPVMDLMHGVVVRGIGGRRDEYQPLVSKIVDSARPLDVARALRDHFGCERLYIADLDGLQGEIPHWESLGWLMADGFELDVDLGLRDLDQARRLLRRSVKHAIVALEAIPDPQTLAHWVQELGVRTTDLQPRSESRSSPYLLVGQLAAVLEIVREVVQAGIRQLIVLDLAHVGSQGGLGTLPLCREIAAAHPQLQIITGGGIRNAPDLEALASEPLAGVLVASVLHDGHLTAREISRCCETPVLRPTGLRS